MAKLYFRYGVMGSGKSLNCLAVRHNYELQGKRVLLIKPSVDQRDGDKVKSRSGFEYKADLLVNADTELEEKEFKELSCLLVDEAQFLSARLVEQLRELTRKLNLPVIAYGLRTDFRGHLFEGSKRLLELADSIEEVKTTCKFCNKKAVFNLRHDSQGFAILDGPVVSLGGEEHYSPVCYECYQEKITLAKYLQKREKHFFVYKDDGVKHFFNY